MDITDFFLYDLSSCYFQKTLDTILQGISRVICYINDILVTRDDDEDHLQNLGSSSQASSTSWYLNEKSKCHFMKKTKTAGENPRKLKLQERTQGN